ncbi:MAG: efflux RND transporter periplasmic adaptor subunit [Betaproteobacteria bacterium]|nr:efflux RND transporter periplasmic adaptor subunit [Betaproteobacteria bacterium]
MNRVSLAVVVSTLVAVSLGAGYWFGRSQSKAPSQTGAPANQTQAKPGGPPPGIAVEATKVASIQLPQSISAVGTLRSEEAVVLRPEVPGRIAEITFKEGQRVEKGQVLIKLDSTVQRAELEQAKANLFLNKSKLDRALDLQKKGFISSQAKDEAENNYRVSRAAADLAEARLAKLELRAPFSGIAGLRLVSVGDYVKDGQDLVNIEEVDPLKVDFRVPEIYLRQIAVGQALQLGADAFPNQAFEGKVFAINPLVDANGRSIVIRALVKNAGNRMRPGMFARVRLIVGGVQDSLVIPEQALIPVGDDLFVFKVVDNKAQRAKIDIGQRRQALVEVVRGLAKDEVVVTAGHQKIREGSVVKAQFVPPAGNAVAAPATPPATGAPPPAPAAAGKS